MLLSLISLTHEKGTFIRIIDLSNRYNDLARQLHTLENLTSVVALRNTIYVTLQSNLIEIREFITKEKQ